MVNLVNLRADVKDLLLSQRFAVLATEGEEYPYSGLVAYLYNTDEEKLYVPILKDNPIYHNIKNSPHVSLVIDNNKNSSVTVFDTQSMTLLGKAKEVYERKKGELINEFYGRYECLHELLNNDNCAIVEIHVHKYIFSSDLSDTIVFDHF